MFAVIETGGKQYWVSPGSKLKIEKLASEAGGTFVFDKVLLVVGDKDELSLGHPYVPSAKVEAMVLRDGRERKKIVFRYHSKTRYRKKKGHRQSFTEVQITKISG
jgi:large subunit ribosomal protein L21